MKRCSGCMAEYKSEYGVCPHCGYTPETTSENSLHIQPGSILSGRYVVGNVVGFGGFGVTYIGWDNTLQQRVAIKEYLPSEFATRAVGQTYVTVFSGNKAEQFAVGMIKFVEEARRLAQFQNEPGIVRVFDSFEANNTAYIVMEYLDGETLTAYLEREGKMSVEKAIELLTPVISSLENVHKAGIIHRDIAPDNIMLTKDGEIKLIDFGAARYATTSHSRSLTVMIKPGYSPEEQYRSRGDQGSHTDVYALGAVLYRMITGTTPPDALERRAYCENKKKDILLPPSKQCKIDKSKENAILNAMNVQIEDRTKTASEFLKDLNSVTPVKRLAGKIKALDLMKWPLWAKILIPAGGLSVAALFALLLTGQITFSNNLVTDFMIGADMTRVPSVINCSVGVAQEKLELQELSSVISGREPSGTIPANMVLRQGVNAGGVVSKGTRVELYVSAEEEPVVEVGSMPDVSFYSLEEAQAMLQELDTVVTVEEEFSPDVAEGIVIRASVGYGEPLSPGDTVIVYVSKGPDPEEIVAPEAEETSPTPNTPSSPVTPDVKLNRSSLNLFVGDSISLTASGGDGSFNWRSNNSKVVSVKDGLVTAIGKGSATITVSSNGKSTTCSVTVQDYSLKLSESNLDMHVGDSKTLSVSGVPTGTKITWSSGDTSVAVVLDGKVIAMNSGTTTIKASGTYGGRTYSRECFVEVNEVGISISNNELFLDVGATRHLSATTTPRDGKVSWSSSDTSVVTVDNSGTIKVVGSGEASVTAEFYYNEKSYRKSCYITSARPSIDISDSQISLMIGNDIYLSATTTPDNSDNRNVSWTSSNESVATVNSKGKVTAVGGGTAIITATMTHNSKTYSDTCRITVDLPDIEISESSLFMTEGDVEYLSVSDSFSNADVEWSSSDTSVATVNSNGKVTAVGAGSAKITASVTYNNSQTYSDTCRVTVESDLDLFANIEISDSSLWLDEGEIEYLSISSDFDIDVEWSSNNTSVATVSSSGKVTAKGEGTTTITATISYENQVCEATCRVKVDKIIEVSIKDPLLSMTVGESQMLDVRLSTVFPSEYTLTSSNTDVIIVDPSTGKATAVGVGSSTITVTQFLSIDETYYDSASCTIHVSAADGDF